MLEPISLGQARTHCPGLAADERGVVMGRSLALFFIDLPRTVSFFRSFSRELSLDEIYSSLEIKQVKGETGGQEIMVRFDVAGSNQADRAAQAALGEGGVRVPLVLQGGPAVHVLWRAARGYRSHPPSVRPISDRTRDRFPLVLVRLPLLRTRAHAGIRSRSLSRRTGTSAR